MKRRPRSPKQWRTYVIAVAVVLLSSSSAIAQREDPLQGNPFRGRELLKTKLCTECHSIWGHGGQVGPDLSIAVADRKWLELVGDFWNHTPRMIDAMETKGHAWPTLTREEMADVLGYLYYLRLFDEPGDPTDGSVAFFRLRCASCHTLGGEGGTRGGPLDQYSSFTSSVSLAQAMWNAGPVMQAAQIGTDTAIPQFVGNEVADLQAYIRSAGIRTDRNVVLLTLPDPQRGARLFETKKCSVCHSRARGAGPDLATRNLNLSVSEISAVLWNHSYEMFSTMRASGITFPKFEGNELADLISYLHFIGFFSEKGDAKRGEIVFRDRGCVQCHAGRDPSAIDLRTSAATEDSISLSAAMWNHAPEMHKLMAELAVAWPQFGPGEMEDLSAYLKMLGQESGWQGREVSVESESMPLPVR